MVEKEIYLNQTDILRRQAAVIPPEPPEWNQLPAPA
jgi:hypothetical protein